MLIYNKALSRGQPPLSSHLPVPQGWPLNKGSTVFWIQGFREIHLGKIKLLTSRTSHTHHNYTYHRGVGRRKIRRQKNTLQAQAFAWQQYKNIMA